MKTTRQFLSAAALLSGGILLYVSALACTLNSSHEIQKGNFASLNEGDIEKKNESEKVIARQLSKYIPYPHFLNIQDQIPSVEIAFRISEIGRIEDIYVNGTTQNLNQYIIDCLSSKSIDLPNETWGKNDHLNLSFKSIQ